MPDLVFTIKTPAELAGAESAAQQLEVNIGKAKALGKETAELEAAHARATASINAYKASLAAAVPPVEKLTDETERYQKALEKMDRDAHEAKASAAQLAIDNKNAAAALRGAGAAADNAGQALDETAASTQDLAEYNLDALNPALEHYTKATEEGTAATDKDFISKKQAKDAVKGLAGQYPELAALARLALNPITLATTAGASAVAVYNARVRELTASFAGVELPNLETLSPVKINEQAEAWAALAESVGKAVAAYNGVAESSDRATKAIAKQAEQQKKLLAANKNLELAGATTPEQKTEIEDRYAAAGLRVDEKSARAAMERKYARMFGLEKEAQIDKSKAAGITIASPEEDAQIERDLKKRADASEAAIAERKKRRDDISDWQNGNMAAGEVPAFAWNYSQRYGYGMAGGDAMKLEDQGIAAEQPNVDRYNEFLKAKRARDEQRRKRDELNASAASKAAEAERLRLSLPEEEAAMNQDVRVNQTVEEINRRARERGAETESRKRFEPFRSPAGDQFKSTDAGNISAQGQAAAASIKEMEAAFIAALDNIKTTALATANRVSDSYNG